LSAIALVCLIFTATLKIIRENSDVDIIKRSLDIITIAVPQALPSALTHGLTYAQNLLYLAAYRKNKYVHIRQDLNAHIERPRHGMRIASENNAKWSSARRSIQ